MDFDFTILTNYGALGVVLGYFIYKDNSTMKRLNETMRELKETVSLLKERVSVNV